ncbi:hypothetical protein LWM68_05745 [Niabella sp. W65]|nr:hypothetical protein [Niabella sp. W65]MCH7362309.1 hypothetical protein [Niabella sp. W65]
MPGNVDMATKNNALYADMNRELWTIDITDPTNPSVKISLKMYSLVSRRNPHHLMQKLLLTIP